MIQVEKPGVVSNRQATHDSGQNTKDKILRMDILHTSAKKFASNLEDDFTSVPLMPYYGHLIDPDCRFIEIIYHKDAQSLCEIHYRLGGEPTVIGLLGGANPKDYQFPVNGKIVAIKSSGICDGFIAMLMQECIEQGALKVFGVINNELEIREVNHGR